MSEQHQPPANGLRYRLEDHERRIMKMEAFELAVMKRAIDDLEGEVKGLRRALLQFGGSVVVGAIIFAFSVFELLGR